MFQPSIFNVAILRKNLNKFTKMDGFHLTLEDNFLFKRRDTDLVRGQLLQDIDSKQSEHLKSWSDLYIQILIVVVSVTGIQNMQ